MRPHHFYVAGGVVALIAFGWLLFQDSLPSPPPEAVAKKSTDATQKPKPAAQKPAEKPAEGLQLPIPDQLPNPFGDKLPIPLGDKLPNPLGDKLPNPLGDKLPIPDKLPIELPKEMPTDIGNPGNLTKFGTDLFQKATQAIDEQAKQYVKLTPEEEKAAGEKVNQHMLERHAELKAETERIRALALPVLQSAGLSPDDYHFHVLDTKEVNAFSHVGGYVYVCKGLLDLIPDDVPLQFVIGHEIAHIHLGHCADSVAYSEKASKVGGDMLANLTQLIYRTLEAGYSEEKEFAADDWAYRIVHKQGAKLEDVLVFFERLDKLDGEDKPEQPEKSTPIDIPIIDDLGKHFETHPANSERTERLKKLDQELAG